MVCLIINIMKFFVRLFPIMTNEIDNEKGYNFLDAVLRSNKDVRLEGGSDKGVDQMVREETIRRRKWARQERRPRSSKRDGRKTVSQKSL